MAKVQAVVVIVMIMVTIAIVVIEVTVIMSVMVVFAMTLRIRVVEGFLRGCWKCFGRTRSLGEHGALSYHNVVAVFASLVWMPHASHPKLRCGGRIEVFFPCSIGTPFLEVLHSPYRVFLGISISA